MNTIIKYETQNGNNAITISENNGRFSYIGKYGAGSGIDFDYMKSTLETIKQSHKRIKLVFGNENYFNKRVDK
jgi:hypothetical protein